MSLKGVKNTLNDEQILRAEAEIGECSKENDQQNGRRKANSALIQDELLNISADQIRSSICREANNAAFIAVIVDDSKDVSHKEQMSLCIRYVSLPQMTVSEEFLLVEHATAVDATSLCSNKNQALQSLGLTHCTIVAQCYDGASVMSGALNGIQAQFSRIHKCALYVHCHAHRLNLVIVSVAHQVKLAERPVLYENRNRSRSRSFFQKSIEIIIFIIYDAFYSLSRFTVTSTQVYRNCT